MLNLVKDRKFLSFKEVLRFTMLNLVKDRKFLSFKEVFKVYYAKPGQRPEVSFF